VQGLGKKLLRQAPTLLGVLLLVGAIYVVQREFRGLKLADIQAALNDLPIHRLAVSFLWTVLAFGILSFYDRLGTIYAGHVVSHGKAAFASFCAYTLAHNLGFAAVSGAAVRYRLYAQWGLTPLQIGKVVAFCSLTFGLGALVLGGGILFAEPDAVPFFGARLSAWVMYAIGAGMWVIVGAYVTLSRLVGTVRIFGHEIGLPGWRMAILQVLLATVDVGVTAAIFYALLPEAPGLTYLRFLGIYLASYTAGMAANLPGGLGVFDTAVLLGLEPYMEPPQIVGAILVFRLYYYIIPLFLAGGLFAGNELLLRGRGVLGTAAQSRGVQAIGLWSQPDLVAAAGTGAVALCGALLMSVGVLEGLGDWGSWEESYFWMISEVGAYSPSLVGAALMVMAVGLSLRVRLAWTGSIALLLTGAVFVVLHGGLPWVAGVLVLAAALIAPFGRNFYRHANLLTGKLRAGTVLPLVTLIACVMALASFEPKLRWLDANAFWAVILSPDVPNSLRTSLAGVVALALVALWRLVRPGRVEWLRWNAVTSARFAALGAEPPALADGLVWGETGRAAIAFRRLDTLLLALGDPAGDRDDRVSAIWRLRDLARQEGRNPAAWQAGRGLLGTWGDLGLTALPLGADGMPSGEEEGAPGPHAERFLVCQAERDLPRLLPLLARLKG
jgi:uncharacterized membrane protein YbhN (UPF0104 family)